VVTVNDHGEDAGIGELKSLIRDALDVFENDGVTVSLYEEEVDEEDELDEPDDDFDEDLEGEEL
jgi:hypothetical protein